MDWGSSSVWLERLPVTQKVASSSLVYPANSSQTDGVMVAQRFLVPLVGVQIPVGLPISFFCLTNIHIYNILYTMKQIAKELDKIKEQISISNGYTDDVRVELNKINETLILIAQILKNK